jgi:signal transduction histidine kinase
MGERCNLEVVVETAREPDSLTVAAAPYEVLASVGADVVRSSSLLQFVPPEVVQRVLANLELLEFAAGEQVIAESVVAPGAVHSELYVVVEGNFAVTRALSAARAERLSTMGPGDFFGELPLVDDGPRSATVTALMRGLVARIPGPVVDRLVAEAPVVMRTIAATIARRLRAADEARVSARLNEERLSLIGKTAAMLVHDLRNPIGAVIGFADLIRDGVGNAPNYATRIKRAATFMADMVDDLLAYAKGGHRYAAAPVTLREIIDDVEEFGLAPLERTGRVLVRRSVLGEGTITGDRRAISRALLNIIKNAVEAMGSKGTLDFEVTIDLNVVRFRVRDTGPGIPPELLPMLFEPFSTHGKKGGTGLGLAMTKAAIDAHGGDISITTGPEGTHFEIALTLSAGSPSSA